MLCAISGEAPQEPVVSKLSGTVYEKRLIEKYVEENGKDPVSGQELSLEDLLPLKTARTVRPRPPTLTSIPALLSTFQNEWDALALETFNLREQLTRTREELATALYQHDAAVRVIARLTQERDEARDALSRVSVSAGGAAGGDDSMAVDEEGPSLPEELASIVDDTQATLSKSRKKRPLPGGWATPDEVAAFDVAKDSNAGVEQATTLSIESGYAAIGSKKGQVAIYSIEAGSVERSIQVGEPVTDSIWTGSKVVVATARGSVKVFESGSEVASFDDHDGAATGLALHPSGDIIASVGADKSFVYYDLANLRRATKVRTDTAFSTCAFHPDGHLFAAGTVDGVIRMYMTKTGDLGASFTIPGNAAVKSISFSENGYWFAAAAQGSPQVTIFDLRKEGDASTAKILEIGEAVQSLAWDYSQQFLATAGPGGITVQQYSKSSKKWSEAVRKDFASVGVRWGQNAKQLVAVASDGKVGVFEPAE